MKKFKRLLAVFMSAVILLCIMPISSFAAQGIRAVETQLNVSPGTDINNWDEYFTVNTAGVEVASFLVFDDSYGVADEIFEIGDDYYLEIVLCTTDGYAFPDSEFEFEGAFINGEEAQWYLISEEDGSNYIVIEYIYNLGGSISAVDLALDIYGDMAAGSFYEYITINSNGIDFYYGNYHPIKVYDAEGNDVDYFASENSYTFEIFLEPKEDCWFNKDDSGSFAMESVTVNGEAVEYYIDSYTSNGYYEYIKIVAQITAKTSNYIKDVSFDIDADLVGVDVNNWESFITIHTPGLIFENYLDDPAVWAVNSKGDYVDTLEKGDIYTLYICFRADEGYFISQANETFDSLKINGEEYGNYYFSDYIAEDGKYIYYVCVEKMVDLVGDGFFDKLIYFFKTLFADIRDFFLSLFVEQY
ncbi:MAG: hypothetical protein J6B25_05680 [Clostridia bacterium]|nr:hypothetical protein [Clostridia bacterium]